MKYLYFYLSLSPSKFFASFMSISFCFFYHPRLSSTAHIYIGLGESDEGTAITNTHSLSREIDTLSQQREVQLF